MKKIVCSLAAVAALGLGAASATGAAAATYSLLPLPVATTGVPSSASAGDDNRAGKSTASFTDDFLFTVAGNYSTALGGLYFEQTPSKTYQIATTDLTLFTGTPTTPGSELGTTGVVNLDDATAGVPSISLTEPLTAGQTYFLQDVITVPAGKLGSYTISAVASPMSAAPEPSSWMLMIGGVAMAGVALRFGRRSLGSLAA